jgi:hypothetical protein
MSDIEQELGWMKRSPYTEGWPKKWPSNLEPNIEVVPLSDAERLREALERAAFAFGEIAHGTSFEGRIARWREVEARAALDPDDGRRWKRALDREGEE